MNLLIEKKLLGGEISMEEVFNRADDDDDVTMESSTESLGLEYQLINKYNKLLPYADELNKEAINLLAEIKGQLGRAVMLRKLEPECTFATLKLQSYIKLYSLRFTKEDHIIYVKLYYDLVTIPNLDLSLLILFGSTLVVLLRKEKLLSPSDLELPWRPLYDLKKRLTQISVSASDMHRYVPRLSKIIHNLIVEAAVYFPITATREILDEFRPNLCPLDVVTMSKTMENLDNFLPLYLSPENHNHGFKLWFDEFMKIWEVSHNAAAWEHSMMWLMAKLSWRNIGYIDWEPHIPLMFTRFIRCLNLPVHYKHTQGGKLRKIEAQPIAIWIVSILGNNSSGQMHLEKLLRTVETYFYQANVGAWVDKLKDLVSKLATQFVYRLSIERYVKRSWHTPIPDGHKLTDDDVDAFVKCMMPVAMTAMFGQTSMNATSTVFRLLATIRPNLVIPDVIDRMFSTFDSLTEPHKLTASMSAVTAVARPLIQGSRNINKGYTYNEGPSRVIPLLISSLPGIDGNDLVKSFATFRLISVYARMVPIADCSRASSSDKLDEDDRLVCEETAQFEDFMLQFFDRIFSLIESSTLDYVSHEHQEGNGKSKVESMVEMALGSVCMMLLLRTSNDIYQSVLHKLREFVTERILETKVSGPLAASLCRSFSRVNGRETLKALLPRLAETVLEFTNDDIDKDENLDNRFLYALLLIANIVDTRGTDLLPYVDTLTEILDKTLHLKSREGNKLASRILRTLLLSLSNIGVYYNFTYGGKDYNDPNYLYILDWGQGTDIEQVELNWYVPGEEEIETIQKLLDRYLPSELTKLGDFIKSNSSITRQELLTSLNIISAIVDGTSVFLPLPEDEGKYPEQEIMPFVGIKGEIKMPNGGNVREELIKIFVDLQSTMLRNSEDDTKSLKVLPQIWSTLLLGKYRHFESHKRHSAALRLLQLDLRDDLVKKKKHIAECILERAELQHEIRIYSRFYSLRKFHKDIIMQLFLLSTSTYADVRASAQDILFISLNYFPYSYKFLMESLVDLLGKDPEENHEAHKGLLYLLRGPRPNALAVTRDWSFLKRIWPALVMSKPSEKMSVIWLKNGLTEHICRNFHNVAIKLQMPDNCVTAASEFWTTSPRPSALQPGEREIDLGIEEMKQREKENIENYDELVKGILGAIEANCHWRQRAMGMKLMRELSHPDRNYSASCINYFLNALLHDSLEERKIAIPTIVTILRQLKREHLKITIDPPKSPEVPCPGLRPDNVWLQYNHENRPLSESQWNETRYIHEPYVGYYTWPKQLDVYAPSPQQTSLSPSRTFTDSEKLVEDFFNDPQNIERLMKFNSLEERKGKDKFNESRFQLYKGLFRNHGMKPLKNFLPHLQSLVRQKQESCQLCAAEVIAGVIRGSKHWPFHMVDEMWSELLPIIRIALDNITPETARDWGLCFSQSLRRRDPNRHHWLIECLMEEPTLANATVSFLECQRLYIIHSSLINNSWRVSELNQRLLNRVEQRLIAVPFQNVRDSLGILLTLIFLADYDRNCDDNLIKPRAKDLMNRVLPKLLKLSEIDSTQFEEKKQDISLLKTVCKWIYTHAFASDRGTLPSSMKLLSVLCQLENYEADDELRTNCRRALAALAQTQALPVNLVEIFEAIENVFTSSSWSARESCLCFVEVFVFYNMSLILSDCAWVERVHGIVMKLLADERVEVREKAGQVLCGLLHCNFILNPEKLLEDFQSMSKLRIHKPDDLRVRHAGVLGLCAFVRAHPYHVPKYVPSIFEYLSLRLNDPQPIPTTIRQTLGDFKRTHYDGWSLHAQSFTDEQLGILQDLTVPPSHYA